MKVADKETKYEHFGGTAYDPAWMPSYMKVTSRYSSYADPSWTKDPKVLKKHKIYWNVEDRYDPNDSYWIDLDARCAFEDAGENSGINTVHYTAFPNTSVGWFEGAPAENYELSKKHPFLAKLKGFDAGKYEKFMADIASENRLGLNKEQTDAYDKDFADRYGKAITPERYNELQRLQGTPEYKRKLKEYVAPWARDYSKQKTAAVEHFSGGLSGLQWKPQYNKYTDKVVSHVSVPSWTNDTTTLRKHNILYGYNDEADANDYDKDLGRISKDARKAFYSLGENSGITSQSYRALSDRQSIPFLGTPAKAHDFYKKHPTINKLMGNPAKKYENFMQDINAKNIKNFEREAKYCNELSDRLGKAITLERYQELKPLIGTPEYNAKIKEYVKPWVRNYSKQKTAALAEELNPVPKPKRDRSVFQKFGDTLSTNKAKHIVGVAGGISGMLTGKELLHSNLTPMRALGGVGVVGGAALGAKNIYGLYNDYFD